MWGKEHRREGFSTCVQMCNSLDLRTGERTWPGRPEDLAGSKEEKGLGRGCKSNASHSSSTAVARALGEMQMLNGACDCISEGPQVMRTLGTPAGPRHGLTSSSL